MVYLRGAQSGKRCEIMNELKYIQIIIDTLNMAEDMLDEFPERYESSDPVLYIIKTIRKKVDMSINDLYMAAREVS